MQRLCGLSMVRGSAPHWHGAISIIMPGATLQGSIFGSHSNNGAIWLLYGTNLGIRLGGNQPLIEGDIPAGFLNQENALFGASLAAGDFNGDGFTDLAVGVPGHTSGQFTNGSCSTDCVAGAGLVFVL